AGDPSHRRPKREEGQEDPQPQFHDHNKHTPEQQYENPPSGHHTTLLDWLGLGRDQEEGRMRYADLLTDGGRLNHETHYAPLQHQRGESSGDALEVKASGGTRLPGMVTSRVKTG
ncbi:histidine kinase, partial [Streptomyces sp. BE20]|nr:histidine kinase [Streptomyces sp. BE20]